MYDLEKPCRTKPIRKCACENHRLPYDRLCDCRSRPLTHTQHKFKFIASANPIPKPICSHTETHTHTCGRINTCRRRRTQNLLTHDHLSPQSSHTQRVDGARVCVHKVAQAACGKRPIFPHQQRAKERRTFSTPTYSTIKSTHRTRFDIPHSLSKRRA